MHPTASATPASQRNVLRGAIFIMATSSIGPAFLTQTSLFTEKYLASFAFAIVISLLIDIGAQLNIWRIITVANLRGQDVANRVLPGIGHLISAFIVLGGIAFNIGNIGGAGLAMNVIFGMPPVLGSLIAAVLIIGIFLLRNAKGVMDSVMQVLGLVMLCMIGYAMLQSSPPVMEALSRSINPDDPLVLLLSIVTLVGGTVGGYISFSGGHRLVEAGITGVENVGVVTRAAVTGIATTGVVRICLFLAALGVVSQGMALDAGNPAASVFSHSMGTIGYKMFGIVLLAASVSSVIGAAYTSVTFMYSLHESIQRHNQRMVIAFIACSTLIYGLVGQPVKVLVVAGTLNALVLPLALACILWAAKKPGIVGSEYRHPTWMLVFGLLAMAATAVGVVMSFNAFVQFWQS
ncbi:NRAMP family divalent metal transporter [Stutzerimonas stutzeri]|uniref:NRAMP family divalent metal transporter n=1 Tax=Stutzerimonas TaxID=2901164 RepID=UPI001BAE59F3|nr:NRAMP family divalent metal transporter [Stutzerimonas stutzeri]QUE77346.1 divalent metal cation transporter [Stutzerimonas stutzeri]